MPSLFFRSAVSSFVFGAVACTQTQSTDVPTTGTSTDPGIAASMKVTADVTGKATAVVDLTRDGSPTDYIVLSPGDTLTAASGTQTELMAENDGAFDEVDYTAAFANRGAEGTGFTVSLRRVTGIDAPMSTCVMPAPFEVTSPSTVGESPSLARSAGDVLVTYAPSGGSDPVSWSLSATCENGSIDSGSTYLEGDPGSFTIPASALTLPETTNAAQGNCQVTVKVDRTRAGSLDPAFAVGTIVAVQERTVTFTSTP